jgi:tail tube protein
MSRIDAVGIAAQNGSGPNGMGEMVTAMEYWVPAEEASPQPNMETMEADETVGSRFPTDREVGGVYYNPSITGKCRATNLPRLASSFLCDPVSTDLSVAQDGTGPFEHVQDPTAAGAEPRAVSILEHRADPAPPITDLFYDCLGNELTLSVEPNDWLSFEANWIARSLDDTQPPPTVVQDLSRRFPFYTMTAYVSVDGGAEAAFAIQSFEAAWSSNIATDVYQLGSRDLFRVAPGNVDLEVTFRPLQDLAEYYRRAFLIEAEPIALRLEALGPLIDATNRYKVELNLARLIETEAAADVNAGETLLGVDITSQAALDPGTGEFFTLTVVNAVPDYAVV